MSIILKQKRIKTPILKQFNTSFKQINNTKILLNRTLLDNTLLDNTLPESPMIPSLKRHYKIQCINNHVGYTTEIQAINNRKGIMCDTCHHFNM